LKVAAWVSGYVRRLNVGDRFASAQGHGDFYFGLQNLKHVFQRAFAAACQCKKEWLAQSYGRGTQCQCLDNVCSAANAAV
jgi:hypothetical protein